MKPLPIAMSLAILALPLFASDGDQAKKNTTITTLSAPPAAQAQDSPLVRAAKASGRLGKKSSIVITNDTLLKAGGHWTTTTVTTPLPPAPQPAAVNPNNAYIAAQQKKQAAEEKAKKDAEAKKEQALRRAAADYNGESIEERTSDPAMQEHTIQQLTPPQPAKPPQN
jgi:hypothetical protein